MPGDSTKAPPETVEPSELDSFQPPTSDIETSLGAKQTLIKRFRLSVINGANADERFTSSSQRTIIGTHESADFVPQDRTVSRFHCEITLERGRAFIRDLGSRNGTFVNDIPVMHAELCSGVIITVGTTRLRFDLGPDHVPIALSEREEFGLMVGRSMPMRAVFAVLEHAATSDATVLVEGETGTGKEVAAESIHQLSRRCDGPFVVVDCGAIPSELLESELFGHERGAFTGAIAARQGAFKAAGGGTIFLDEIGELSSDLQPKLLRALERREIKPVGRDKYEPIDVRVIAATNRNLRAEVNARGFRSDLYYRLAVLQVRLPALRERPEDLPPLVDNILSNLGVLDSPEAASLRTRDFIAKLARHSWPGNVRELRNYLERCLAMREQQPLEAETSQLDPDSLLPIDWSQPMRTVRDRLTREFERRYLEKVLARNDGNVTAAARSAGVHRAFFYRLLWRHGLR